MLDAPFVAVIQIVVYAGAIMVLFLFVVMLLNAPHEDTEADERRHILLRSGPLRFGAFLAVVLASELGWALTRGGESGAFAGGATIVGRRDRPVPLHGLRLCLRGDLGV